MKRVVLVFARYPEPGKVKTRLYPHLSYLEAAALYRAMVEDAVTLHSGRDLHDTVVCFTPQEARGEFRKWLGDETQLMTQIGENLGARQLHAFERASELGYDRMIIIGSDCPLIGQRDIESAYQALEEAEVVLGPSNDGGYYLIGAREPHACLFDGIRWGTCEVLEETLRRSKAAGISTILLEGRFDIDRFEDVTRLYSILKNQKEEKHGGGVVARNTLAILESIIGGDR